MKNRTLFAFLLFSGNLAAQTPFTQIVEAENRFENSCSQVGIKQGFLAHMDSTAIAFTRNGIVNARTYWESLPDFPGIYSWSPSFAEVSLAGDWGYSTGAVEFRDSSEHDNPSSYNQYTTVWHRNKKGEWKYLVDIGNSHGEVKIDRVAMEIKTTKIPVRNLSKQMILQQEKLFASSFKANAYEAMKKFYSRKYLLNITGSPLIAIPDSAISRLKPYSQNIQFEPVDVRISPAGDMAVISGYLYHLNIKKHYLRIWRNEPGGWKIALEVIKI